MNNISSQSEIAKARVYLNQIDKLYAGNSVELRVPFAGAKQLFNIQGANHHRGTPPSTVEMSVEVFIKLYEKEISYRDAIAKGLIEASGRDASEIQVIFD